MRKRELDNFIIESFVDIDYYDEMFDYVVVNEKDIFDFFVCIICKKNALLK